jgi:hypothetical protein
MITNTQIIISRNDISLLLLIIIVSQVNRKMNLPVCHKQLKIVSILS